MKAEDILSWDWAVCESAKEWRSEISQMLGADAVKVLWQYHYQ